jgi:hypothetical protein
LGGYPFWFTFVTVSEVEPTNNRAERALRELVVHRKIIGTLESKGRADIRNPAHASSDLEAAGPELARGAFNALTEAWQRKKQEKPPTAD